MEKSGHVAPTAILSAQNLTIAARSFLAFIAARAASGPLLFSHSLLLLPPAPSPESAAQFAVNTFSTSHSLKTQKKTRSVFDTWDPKHPERGLLLSCMCQTSGQ